MFRFPAEEREVFERRLSGRLHVVDTASDADEIVAKFGGNRDDLRFRITYSGQLKAGGKKPRVQEKDAIRRYVSSQLKELWGLHPVFQGLGLVYKPPRDPFPPPNVGHAFPDIPVPVFSSLPKPEPVEVSPDRWRVRNALNEAVHIKGRQYVPLVRNSLAITCGLDILFLRKDGPGPLIAEGGDLDNRIKTLFDGLRVPKPDEVTAPASAEEAAEAVFCLLEDDALITDFSVRTDRLLTHPGASESEVLLIIDVVVRVSHLTSNNLGFLSE